MRTKVIFLSEQRLLRDLLSIAFTYHQELELIPPVADTEHAIESLQSNRTDVIVVDLNPSLFGLRVARQLQDACPDCKIVVLMSHADPISEMQLLLAGVRGVVSKDVGLQDVVWAIRQIIAGRTVFAQDGELVAKEGFSCNSVSGLTTRELQVLELVAKGYANKQIASELGISIKTVEKHRQRLMCKLKAHETAGLTSRAICMGVAPGNGTYPLIASHPSS